MDDRVTVEGEEGLRRVLRELRLDSGHGPPSGTRMGPDRPDGETLDGKGSNTWVKGAETVPVRDPPPALDPEVQREDREGESGSGRPGVEGGDILSVS